jgi:hypothetical protein
MGEPQHKENCAYYIRVKSKFPGSRIYQLTRKIKDQDFIQIRGSGSELERIFNLVPKSNLLLPEEETQEEVEEETKPIDTSYRRISNVIEFKLDSNDITTQVEEPKQVSQKPTIGEEIVFRNFYSLKPKELGGCWLDITDATENDICTDKMADVSALIKLIENRKQSIEQTKFSKFELFDNKLELED